MSMSEQEHRALRRASQFREPNGYRRVGVNADKLTVRLEMLEGNKSCIVELGSVQSPKIIPWHTVPTWIQDRVMALSLLPAPSPTVELVGERATDTVFWIWRKEE